MLWVLIPIGLIAFTYFILIKPFKYWETKGAPQLPLTKLWLEIIRSILQLSPHMEIMNSMYRSSSGRYVGAYQFLTPVLFLKDPDLIKQITLKDFDHFIDHHQFVSEELQPLWGKNLLALRGDRWKDMRGILSPCFTSSKIKSMFGLMSACAEQFVRHFQNGSATTVTIELKDAFTRYANDVIASTAFGITCDSLKDRENEFYIMGKQATNLRGFWKNMKIFAILIAPKLSQLFGIQVYDKHVSEFFRRLVKTNIESREKNGIVRPDMIHLLMEARKGRLEHEQSNGIIDTGFAVIEESKVGKEEKRRKMQLSDDDLTAQALLFFLSGFESVSTLLCFVVYELAVNTDVQQKLRNEVDDALKDCNGSLTYEALLKMKYMDMVISEALRKWPPGVSADRLCVKSYTIEPTKAGETPIHLKQGDVLWLPIYALHRDERFYSEPDRFDPERFNEENKGSISPYSYIPFGSGPRSCIGNRFALLEIKTVLFHLLTKFEVVVVEKSTVPIKIAKYSVKPTAENGFWFGLKKNHCVT